MSLDLSAEDRKALAKDLAAELDTGRYGSRFVLSRRQLLSIAGGSAGVAALVALGVDPATAQSAAGQVGTEASPEDVFAYNLDVQTGAEFNGTDVTGVGVLSAEQQSIIQTSDSISSGEVSYQSSYMRIAPGDGGNLQTVTGLSSSDNPTLAVLRFDDPTTVEHGTGSPPIFLSNASNVDVSGGGVIELMWDPDGPWWNEMGVRE